MNERTQIIGADEGRVAALARAMAAALRPPAVVLLDGPVGAGKSHFARAFIRARQGEAAEDVPSPTFTLVQVYDDAAGEIWHADLYRLSDPAEVDELGLADAMDEAICLIEWPDRLEAVPEGAIWLRIAPGAAPDLRDVTIEGPGVARIAARAGFVDAAGWGAARVTPLAGDASARAYFRLSGGAVLMDDPAGDLGRWLEMTEWLVARGFAAPAVHAADRGAGFALMEDLGDDLVARVLADTPDMAPAIYARIVDLLVDLGRHDPPGFVAALDGPAMAEQVGLFGQWYGRAVGAPVDPGPVIAALHAQLAGGRAVCALRDFHAENLIWRGARPLGLLDYQDAVAAHPAYDLVSCLQDARRDVDAALEAAMVARFCAATGADPQGFAAAYALMGAQRNLRIMGIFTRLARRDGKPRYLDLMPRVWGYVQRNLAHPALAPLADLLADVPGPDAETMERIAQWRG